MEELLTECQSNTFLKNLLVFILPIYTLLINLINNKKAQGKILKKYLKPSVVSIKRYLFQKDNNHILKKTNKK